MPSVCEWAFSTVLTDVEIRQRRKCFSRTMTIQCGAWAEEATWPVNSLT
ncbi:MAG: hypothetical protein RJA48_1314 [Verrucomicrobiota bacterium]